MRIKCTRPNTPTFSANFFFNYTDLLWRIRRVFRHLSRLFFTLFSITPIFYDVFAEFSDISADFFSPFFKYTDFSWHICRVFSHFYQIFGIFARFFYIFTRFFCSLNEFLDPSLPRSMRSVRQKKDAPCYTRPIHSSASL